MREIPISCKKSSLLLKRNTQTPTLLGYLGEVSFTDAVISICQLAKQMLNSRLKKNFSPFRTIWIFRELGNGKKGFRSALPSSLGKRFPRRSRQMHQSKLSEKQGSQQQSRRTSVTNSELLYGNRKWHQLPNEISPEISVVGIAHVTGNLEGYKNGCCQFSDFTPSLFLLCPLLYSWEFEFPQL